MISIIVPCHNESKVIRKNIHQITDVFTGIRSEYEIIAVDDGSSDDTFEKLCALKLEIGHFRVIQLPRNMGKGAAIKAGWRKCKGSHVIIMDADLQVPPSEIKTFFNIMRVFNADAVIGSKRHAASNVNYSWFRWLISNGYYLMVKILFGMPLQDTQVGFKLFKRSAIDVIMKKVLVKQYAFDIEMMVSMRENHLRVMESPIKMKKTVGKGSVSLRSIFYTAQDTLAVAYRKMKGYYRDA